MERRIRESEEARVQEHKARLRAEEARVQEHEARLRAEAIAETARPSRFIDYLRHVDSKLSSTFSICPAPSTLSTGTTTKVDGKFYPLYLRQWANFPSTHEAIFAEMAECFSDKPLFPSASDVKAMRILNPSRGLSDEHDMARFIETCVETPAGLIATQYLREASHSERTGSTEEPGSPGNDPATAFIFSCNVNGASRDSSEQASASLSEASDVSDTSQAPSHGASEAGERTDTDDEGSPQGTARRNSKRRKMAKPDFARADIGIPDRWGLLDPGMSHDARPLDGGGRHVVPKLVGEYKAAHKLPSSMVACILDNNPDQNFFVHAARVETANVARREAKLRRAATPLATAAAATTGSDTDSTRSDPGLVSDGDSAPSVSEDAAGTRQLGFMRVARLLCQAYHYMITSGLEYGYAASGQTIILLRIQRDDPATLYYFLSSMRPQVQSQSVDDDAHRQARATAVAHMCTQVMLGIRSQVRMAQWITSASKTLARWPKPYAKNNDGGYSTLPSDREDEDEDDGGDDDDDDGRRRKQPRGRLRRTGPQLLPSTSSKRVPSPLRHVMTSELSSRPGRIVPCVDGIMSEAARYLREQGLKFCTQACLLGLCRGTALDPACPNVALHRAPAGDAGKPGRHGITAQELCKLMDRQLSKDMDLGCQSLEQWGFYGAVGVLFRMTLAEYGYTFVAKGVQARHRCVLRREATVYKGLKSVQGTLIPVLLGRLNLQASPYPLSNCTAICHMMLMSYAGSCRGMPKGIDWETEAFRTSRELYWAGLRNGDERRANMAWNAEAGRVMQFDFDHASVVEPTRRREGSEAQPATPPPLQERGRASVTGKRLVDEDECGADAKRLRLK